jgi:hypothetical protein
MVHGGPLRKREVEGNKRAACSKTAQKSRGALWASGVHVPLHRVAWFANAAFPNRFAEFR